MTNLHAFSFCSDNVCTITRSLYLEVLANLLDYLDPASTQSLDDSTSLCHLHTLYAHSLRVCSSPLEEKDTALPGAVVQCVRLLKVAPKFSVVFPPGALASADRVAGVLVEVLKFCRDASLCAHLLEAVSVLSEEVSGAEEVVLCALCRCALQESDPDLLVQVIALLLLLE